MALFWCSGHRASGRPPDLQTSVFRPGVLTRPHDGGSRRSDIEVWNIRHRLEDPPPTLDPLSTEAPEGGVLAPRLRRTMLGRAPTHDSKHTFFHDHPVVAPSRAFQVGSAYDQQRHLLPGRVAQHQTIHHTRGRLSKRSLESDLLLNRKPRVHTA
jgi:hypothetical protein